MVSKLSPVLLISSLAMIFACAHKPTPTADLPPTEDSVAKVDTNVTSAELAMAAAAPNPVFPATPDVDVPPPMKKKTARHKAKKSRRHVVPAIAKTTSVPPPVDRAPASEGGATGVTNTPIPSTETPAMATTDTAVPETPTAAPMPEVDLNAEKSNWMMWFLGALIVGVGMAIYRLSHRGSTPKNDFLYHTH